MREIILLSVPSKIEALPLSDFAGKVSVRYFKRRWGDLSGVLPLCVSGRCI